MRWPWQSQPLEHRDESGYTDALVANILERANGVTAYPTATAALESCAGVVGRAFMGSEVIGGTASVDALNPYILEMMGRSLIRRGDLVFLIDTTGGRLQLLPAEAWDIEGSALPSTWEYRLTIGGPSRTFSHDNVPASSVVHIRYAANPIHPWMGIGPVQVASLSGMLSAETVKALADESSGPRGAILGIPTGGADETNAGLKADIAGAKGGVVLSETGDWGNTGQAYAALKTQRFGANPEQPLVNLAELATQEIVAACGLSIALWGRGNAAATREAWRLCLFGTVAPLGKLVERELRDKIDPELKLSWQELRASDLSGRARAMQSMVGGGMAVEQAIAISGLMTPEEDD